MCSKSVRNLSHRRGTMSVEQHIRLYSDLPTCIYTYTPHLNMYTRTCKSEIKKE